MTARFKPFDGAVDGVRIRREPGRRDDRELQRALSQYRLLAPGGEELRQQLAARLRRNAAGDTRVVIEARLAGHVDHGPARTRLRVARAEHEPRKPRMEYGADAHRTRLERHVQRTAGSR